jgi:hypothetical protein
LNTINITADAKPDKADELRMQLQILQARYDESGISPAIYAVIKQVETDIAWAEHARVRS